MAFPNGVGQGRGRNTDPVEGQVTGQRPGAGLRRAVVTLAAAALLAGCVAMDRNHGYIPPESDLALLVVGQDTRDSVIAAVGAPGSGAVMGEGNFYYVQSAFRHYGPLAPQETDRQVLVMSFDMAGVLTNIERFGIDDGQVVVLSRRVTDNGLRDTTFLRQLMGNLGNFDASTLIGEE